MLLFSTLLTSSVALITSVFYIYFVIILLMSIVPSRPKVPQRQRFSLSPLPPNRRDEVVSE